MNLKKFLPLLPVLLLAGCSTTFTRLTPLRAAAEREQSLSRRSAVQFVAAVAALGQPQAVCAGQWRLVSAARRGDGAEPLGGFRARAAGRQHGRPTASSSTTSTTTWARRPSPTAPGRRQYQLKIVDQ